MSEKGRESGDDNFGRVHDKVEEDVAKFGTLVSFCHFCSNL